MDEVAEKRIEGVYAPTPGFSSNRLSSARSFRFARRIAYAMTGATHAEKPVGVPRFRSGPPSIPPEHLLRARCCSRIHERSSVVVTDCLPAQAVDLFLPSRYSRAFVTQISSPLVHWWSGDAVLPFEL
jgi:hypothetical protein